MEHWNEEKYEEESHPIAMSFAEIILVIVCALLVIGFVYQTGFAYQYNKIVLAQNQVLAQQGQIEEAYQRRWELVPDLVKSIQKYTEYEETIYSHITEARASLQTAIESGDLNEMEIRSSELTEALNQAIVLIEDNPQLGAKDLYLQLNSEIAGSVNRISQARYKYNELAKEYNDLVLTYPGKMYAWIFGFKPIKYLSAPQEAHQYSIVDFN